MSSQVASPELVHAIAHSLDLAGLAPEAAKALSTDAEFRLRELIQDAQKFARHARRCKLTCEDVNNALRMRNVEPLYGFSSKDPAKYMRTPGHPDVFCVHDRELSIEQLVDTPLPRPPVEVSVMPHWLFIDGVQPAIPENAPLTRHAPAARRAVKQEQPGAQKAKELAAAAQQAGTGAAAPGAQPAPAAPAAPAAAEHQSVQVQPSVQHMLSRELQLYFTKAVGILKAAMAEGSGGAGGAQDAGAAAAASTSTAGGEAGPSTSGRQGEAGRMLNAVLASLATDPGLHPLTPYLIKFIGDEVAACLPSPLALHVLLRLAEALLRNEAIDLQPYVHQLLPGLLTCLVARNIGQGHAGGVDHWAVRDKAAGLVRAVCARFGDPYYNVHPRVSKTLLRALLDPAKPLATHYGAIVGLAALGHKTVRLLLLPQLHAYMTRLQPLLETRGAGGAAVPPEARAADAAARAAAARVHGALLDAVAGAMKERMVEQVDVLVAATRPRLPHPTSGAAASEQGQGQPGTSGGAGPMDVDEGAGGAGRGRAAGGAKGKRARTGHRPGGAEPAPPAREGSPGPLPVAEILAEAWREDSDMAQVLAALEELLGPTFTARMPLPRPAHEAL